MKRISARTQLSLRPLTGILIHREMSRLLPKRNDYGTGFFDELVPELAST